MASVNLQKRVVGSVLSALLVASGCSLLEEDVARDEEGQVTETGEVGAFAIQVGDCLGDLEAEVESATAMPCDQAHIHEVFHAFELANGDYPGVDLVSAQSESGCIDAFAGFVGIDYDVSIYGVVSIYPTEESWDRLDDREVLCLLGNLDGTEKVGSAAGTAV